MASRRIAPTIAVIHVEMSKNSSSGWAPNSAAARKPPRSAPDDADDRGDDQPAGIAPRKQCLRDEARQEAEDDERDNAHVVLSIVVVVGPVVPSGPAAETRPLQSGSRAQESGSGRPCSTVEHGRPDPVFELGGDGHGTLRLAGWRLRGGRRIRARSGLWAGRAGRRQRCRRHRYGPDETLSRTFEPRFAWPPTGFWATTMPAG